MLFFLISEGQEGKRGLVQGWVPVEVGEHKETVEEGK
jgi:hypothetical protein